VGHRYLVVRRWWLFQPKGAKSSDGDNQPHFLVLKKKHSRCAHSATSKDSPNIEPTAVSRHTKSSYLDTTVIPYLLGVVPACGEQARVCPKFCANDLGHFAFMRVNCSCVSSPRAYLSFRISNASFPGNWPYFRCAR